MKEYLEMEFMCTLEENREENKDEHEEEETHLLEFRWFEK